MDLSLKNHLLQIVSNLIIFKSPNVISKLLICLIILFVSPQDKCIVYGHAEANENELDYKMWSNSMHSEFIQIVYRQ